MKEELKPCPFCGCDPELEVSEVDLNGSAYKDSFQYSCDNCGVYNGEHDHIEDAIESWNTRSPQSEWIMVDDKLPLSIEDFHEFRKPVIGSLTESVIATDGETSWVAEFYFWSDNTVTGYDWLCLGNVIAWQPLPTPPKGNKE